MSQFSWWNETTLINFNLLYDNIANIAKANFTITKVFDVKFVGNLSTF